MKKLLALLLAALMVLTLVACGSVKDDEKTPDETTGVTETTANTEANKTEIAAPVDILAKIWATYGEDEMFFAMGGDFVNMVDNAPGAYDLSDKEAAASQLVISENALAMVDGAATLFHAMNTNNFTGVAYHVAEGATVQAFIADMQNSIKNNQWICGFPEKLLVAEITEDYVVIAFGESSIMDTFEGKLTAQFATAKVTVEGLN